MILRGRRCYIEEVDRLGWWWVCWRMAERMSGIAPSRDEAVDAVEHFHGKALTLREIG